MTSLNCYSNNNEVSDIEGCFKAIVSKKPVSLSVGTAYKIMQKLCNIPINAAEPKLKRVMPHMLVHHIMKWPGWSKYQKYSSGQISYERWFDTFKNYLTYKLNYVVKNDFEVALYQHMTEDKDKMDGLGDSSKKNEVACQTETVEKPFAPFTMELHLPAMNINTMVFADGPEDSIILKHHIQPGWNFINQKLLLNWPHITVKFSNNEIVIKRSNKHQCVRYLSDPCFKNIFPKPDLLEEVDLINSNKVRSTYTYNLMKQYCDKYLEYFRMQLEKYKANTLWREVLQESEVFLNEYLQDIQDININNSIATNTYTLFNIGGHLYTRNKKLRNSSEDPSVCLFEVFTPKMETSLISFYGVVTDSNGKLKFRTLNNTQNQQAFVPPSLEYTCTYCHVKFLNSKSAINHLYTKHTNEPALLCNDCKQQFNVVDLVNNRWNHNCTVVNSSDR